MDLSLTDPQNLFAELDNKYHGKAPAGIFKIMKNENANIENIFKELSAEGGELCQGFRSDDFSLLGDGLSKTFTYRTV